MKRIALLRFHARMPVALNRIRLLRLFNGDMEIHGLYGGPEDAFPSVEKEVGPELDSLFCIRGKSAHWKWKNFDLALKPWFLERGHGLDFDMLHVAEWDILLLDTLERMFGHVPGGSLGISGIRPAAELRADWVWTARDPHREEYRRLEAEVRRKFGYEGEPYACVACGICLPRAFLEDYSRLEVEELCNDEVRISLYARAMGFDIADTGFYDWERSARYFNLGDRAIGTSAIIEELHRKGGRRAFHPYRTVFNRVDECRGIARAGYGLAEFIRKLRS